MLKKFLENFSSKQNFENLNTRNLEGFLLKPETKPENYNQDPTRTQEVIPEPDLNPTFATQLHHYSGRDDFIGSLADFKPASTALVIIVESSLG